MHANRRISTFLRPGRAGLPGRRLGVGLVLGLALAVVPARAGDAPLRTDELLPGITATVQPGGALVLARLAASSEPLLAADLVTPDVGARRRPLSGSGGFVGRAADGHPGGLRGFSASADDDGDGLVGEDRLDGVDNDRDGLVDEDFAAIGETMLVVERAAADGGGRLEYYHWSQPRLQGAVFASVSGPVGSRWQLTSGGGAWQDLALATTAHSATGKPLPHTVNAFVAAVDPDADCRTGSRWLGVAVLDAPTGGRVGRALVDGRTLALGIGAEPTAVVACVAESWLQLVRLLNDAARVREGLTDPVTGEQAPWIAAPTCQACRTAAAPAFRWRLDRQGDLVMAAELGQGALAMPDPDLLAVGDLRLGAPSQLRWIPAAGEERGVAWSCAREMDFEHGAGHGTDPFAALAEARHHGAAGRLELVFPAPSAALVQRLAGGGGALAVRAITLVSLDGRRLTAELQPEVTGDDPLRAAVALVDVAVAEPSSPARQSQLLRSGSTRAQLSPDLIRGWPNPFRDVISVSFRVPATIGEAFAWDRAEDEPTGLDLEAPVPWQQGRPDASVKVYTMSGQEVATLYDGVAGSGEVVVSWNGTDNYGRKVASGTYFCKLQMDEWSVTRRVVFLR